MSLGSDQETARRHTLACGRTRQSPPSARAGRATMPRRHRRIQPRPEPLVNETLYLCGCPSATEADPALARRRS
jgi:hypothetical protein